MQRSSRSSSCGRRPSSAAWATSGSAARKTASSAASSNSDKVVELQRPAAEPLGQRPVVRRQVVQNAARDAVSQAARIRATASGPAARRRSMANCCDSRASSARSTSRRTSGSVFSRSTSRRTTSTCSAGAKRASTSPARSAASGKAPRRSSAAVRSPSNWARFSSSASCRKSNGRAVVLLGGCCHRGLAVFAVRASRDCRNDADLPGRQAVQLDARRTTCRAASARCGGTRRSPAAAPRRRSRRGPSRPGGPARRARGPVVQQQIGRGLVEAGHEDGRFADARVVHVCCVAAFMF